MQIRAFVAVLALSVAACGSDDPPAQGGSRQGATPGASPSAAPVGANVALPEGVTREMVAQGRQVFNQQTCFTCHGQDGTGTPLAPVLTDGEWLNSDGSFEGIAEIIRAGVAQPERYPAPMPPMGGAQLTEDQVRNLAAYVYAIGHDG